MALEKYLNEQYQLKLPLENFQMGIKRPNKQFEMFLGFEQLNIP
jgi:hypothetical protein